MEKSLLLLISNYVHKLNNEIGLIRTNARLFEYQRSDLLESDEFIANTIKAIKENAENALSLAEEFKLSFASPESKEAVPIKVILSQALQSSDLPQSINVILEVESEIPDIYTTSSLVDVFQNLFINASEAMSNQGTLRIVANLKQEGRWIGISVTDTGRGVPDYLRESLFQPYFSTKNEKGHGLGLWWSKSYLISIGGDLRLVWSDVGKGSEFLVKLPVPEGLND